MITILVVTSILTVKCVFGDVISCQTASIPLNATALIAGFELVGEYVGYKVFIKKG